MKIIAIIGARPQFIKHAPIELAMKETNIEFITIHTGQHYDENMSKVFFDELGMQPPKHMLDIGSPNHGVQTGKMMIEMEAIIVEEKPNAILVYGDTNSTLAGALVAAKLHIPVIHLEAGLRSWNKAMPEEVNRILTDHVSEILLAPTPIAVENLKRENITKKVYLTGDVMCDMVHIYKNMKIENTDTPDEFYYATIHRPYNTDDPSRLRNILQEFENLDAKVILAIHPRTSNKLKSFNINVENYKNINVKPPVSYFENIELQSKAKGLITDSGGMQKEAYMLKTKCVTIRPETEWIETLDGQWNSLCFNNLAEISQLLKIAPTNYKENLYGDGQAAKEIVQLILQNIN